jgi:uracil-DNA glycosylase
MFSQLKDNPKYKGIEDELKKLLKENKGLKIYPLPKYLFASFLITPAYELKVVIIGQDPYFNNEEFFTKNGHSKLVPQGMGLSFSVPHDFTIPSSLCYIYDNLVKFKHLKKRPTTGNLSFWGAQGCLMLNTSLTVEHGKKESHMKMWKWFTDYIIKYISDNFNDIIFLIWGGHAYKKLELIDIDKHHISVSSHPSGLSANKPFGNYPSFMNKDHFGEVNKFLREKGKLEIIWDI